MEFEQPTQGSVWFGFKQGEAKVLLPLPPTVTFLLWVYVSMLLFLKAVFCIDTYYHQNDLTFKIIFISFLL